MPESIVSRVRALQTSAERKLNAEQREQKATKIADRTKIFREWITALTKVTQLRQVLDERSIPGIELVPQAEPAAAQQHLLKYRTAAAWRETEAGSDGQAAWSALQRAIKALVGRVQENIATNVNLQKEAAVAGLSSEEALSGLAAVPGLEARGRTLQLLRKEIADSKWKDLSPIALRLLLDKVHEFLEVTGSLINDDPTLTDEIRAFCALARTPAGAPLSKFTQSVRDWFEMAQHITRLRIHMK